MTIKRKAKMLLQADHLSKLASKLQVNYIHFFRELQEMRNLLAFPFIVVCLGYVAPFLCFIFWRLSR